MAITKINSSALRIAPCEHCFESNEITAWGVLTLPLTPAVKVFLGSGRTFSLIFSHQFWNEGLKVRRHSQRRLFLRQMSPNGSKWWMYGGCGGNVTSILLGSFQNFIFIFRHCLAAVANVSNVWSLEVSRGRMWLNCRFLIVSLRSNRTGSNMSCRNLRIVVRDKKSLLWFPTSKPIANPSSNFFDTFPLIWDSKEN